MIFMSVEYNLLSDIYVKKRETFCLTENQIRQ